MSSGGLIRLLFERLPKKMLIGFAKNISHEGKRTLASSHPNHEVRMTYLKELGVKIGKDAYINENFIIIVDREGRESDLVIGDRVSIATNVTVVLSSAPNKSNLIKNDYVKKNLVKTAPVKIGDDAWLGANAVIFPGVTIGERAVVGAGAIVRDSVPPDTVVAGVPAKVIKKIPAKKED